MKSMADSMVWTVGAIQALCELKLIEGFACKMEPSMVAQWDQLDMDCKPANDEIRQAIDQFLERLSGEERVRICCLAIEYRDRRAELEAKHSSHSE